MDTRLGSLVARHRTPVIQSDTTALADSRRDLGFAVVLSCVVTLLLWVRTSELTVTSLGFSQVGDDHVYRYMATQPIGTFHIAPWSWRILIPLLARYLPFSTQANFEILAFVTVTSTGVLLFLVLRKWGFDRSLAFIGLLLYFSMSYITKFNIRDFWLTDSAAFLFTAAGILALQHRRFLIFAGCMVVGVLAKESVIFIAPLCYTFTAERRWDFRALARTIALALPAVLALLLLRLAIPAWNGQTAYLTSLPAVVRADIGNVHTYNLLAVAHKELLARSHIWLQDLLQVLTSFGALGIALVLAAGSSTREVWGKFWPFLLLVASQLVFTFNTQRLVVLAFVPVAIACLYGVRAIASRYQVSPAVFAAAAIAAVIMELISKTASSPSPLLQVAVFGLMATGVIAWRVISAIRQESSPFRRLAGEFPQGPGEGASSSPAESSNLAGRPACGPSSKS